MTQELSGDEAALQRWEAQKEQWDTFQNKMARKLKRKPNELLQSTQWRFREKLEELDVIDASIPQAIRGGEKMWEMSLRGGAQGPGGVRYVKVGSTYPYPLYCPITDREQLPPDHNTFMRVITQEGYAAQEAAKMDSPATTKLLRKAVETDYYKDKERQFRKHIERRFPHRVNGAGEPLEISGCHPPLADGPVDEVAGTPGHGVTFHHALPASPISQRHVANKHEAITVSARSSYEDSVYQQASLTGSARRREGPHIEATPVQLSLVVQPRQLVQGTVLVANCGSAAVFFRWVRVFPESIVPVRSEPRFTLSSHTEGALLPDEELSFHFSFCWPFTGIFSESWRLETNPNLESEIVLQLRAVVVDDEEDVINRTALESAMDRQTAEELSREVISALFTQRIAHREGLQTLLGAARLQAEEWQASTATRSPLDEVPSENTDVAAAQNFGALVTLGGAAENNVFDLTDVERRKREANAADAAVIAASEAAELRQQQLWNKRNGHRDLTYNTHIYAALEKLHQNIHNYLVVVSSPAGSGIGLKASDGLVISNPPWDGSVATLLEEIQQVDDAQVKQDLLGMYQELLHAAAHPHPSLPKGSSPTSMSSYSLMRSCLVEFIGELVDRSHTLQLNLGLIDEPQDTGKGKGKDKAKKKEEPAKKKPASLADPRKGTTAGKAKRHDEANIDEEEMKRRVEQEYKDKLNSETARAFRDTIDQFLFRMGVTESRTEALIEGNLSVSYAQRIADQEEAYRKQKIEAERAEQEAREKAAREEKEREKEAHEKEQASKQRQSRGKK
eukprot:TRINITY_DN1440_c0_g1_i1.p1 TRINITY_DN1440_c0_g1~~TRINITY_DN1440_c0_g1_i1.p1  ORF type:complete len:793 (+),score=138.61 TRINITY_DN1440_c0_g1_i1:46-2424(+)